MSQMSIRCVCGFVGKVEAGPNATCPDCKELVKVSALLHTDDVEAQLKDWGLLIRLTTKNVKLVDSEQIQRIVFDIHEQTNNVVLDLTKVELVGSSALSVLVRIAMERSIAIVHPSPRIIQTMTAMGILSYFPVFDTQDEAIASFR